MVATKRVFWPKLFVPGVRPLRPADIVVPDGFTIDVAVEGLAASTMIAWDGMR
jgi:hypothetical protein